MKTFNWILSAVLALVLAFGGAPAMAQSSSGQRTDFLPLRTRTDGQIPTPAADWVRLFWNGTGWRYKTPAGAFFDLGGGSSYEFLTASDGILTLFDDTTTTGVSQFKIRAGEGQSTTSLATFFANDGTTARFTFGSTGILTSTIDSSVNDFSIKVGRPGHTDAVRIGDVGYGSGGEISLTASSGNVAINMTGSAGIFMGSVQKIAWTSTPYIVGVDNDVQLKRSAARILCLTDEGSGPAAFEFSRSVVPKVDADSPVTVAAQRSNTVYTNEGADGSVTFELPAAAAGYVYTFAVQDADGDLIIDAAAGDTIRFGSTVTAAGATISITAVGDVITLICINGTEWFVSNTSGATISFP